MIRAKSVSVAHDSNVRAWMALGPGVRQLPRRRSRYVVTLTGKTPFHLIISFIKQVAQTSASVSYPSRVEANSRLLSLNTVSRKNRKLRTARPCSISVANASRLLSTPASNPVQSARTKFCPLALQFSPHLTYVLLPLMMFHLVLIPVLVSFIIANKREGYSPTGL